MRVKKAAKQFRLLNQPLTLALDRVLSPQQAAGLCRTYLDVDPHKVVSVNTKVVDRTTGACVAVLVKHAVSGALLDLAEGTRALSRTRGDAAGPVTEIDLKGKERLVAGKRYMRVMGSDGRLRDKAVASNCVGYNMNGKLSHWTRRCGTKAAAMRPLLQRMLSVYMTYAFQQFKTQYYSCALRFMGLALSSVAVNHDFRCAVHKDRNDMEGTFGVMAVGGDDRVQGGELIFPEYNISFDVRRGDVLLFDSQLFHGNGAFLNSGEFHRISVVAYAR